MKKQIFTLFGAALLTLQASAQITITGYSGVVANTNDTVQEVNASSYGMLADTAQTNKSWDLTTLTYASGTSSYAHNTGASSVFTSAQYYDSFQYIINPLLGYNNEVMYNINASGQIKLGEHILHQTLMLPTGGANDSLGVPLQDVVYSSPDTILKFPFTYNSTWETNLRFVTNFNLTIAAFGINNAPVQRVAYRSDKYAVEGYGKIRVKDASGKMTSYMDVLQVRNTITSSDSFYLGGSPAPTALLSAFALTQGQITTSYTVRYYRAGEVFPLLKVIYTDSTYKTPSQAEVHQQRLSYPTAVEFIANNDNVKVYPNPVAGHTVTVEVPANTTGNWSYSMINVNGQQITSGALHLNGQTAQVAIPAGVAAGVYYMQLNNEGKNVAVKTLEISK